MANQTVFETTGMDDPLGLWATAPGTVSFSTDGAIPAAPPAGIGEPVFRVKLQTGPGLADEAFGRNETYIAGLNAALENIPDRLDRLVARTQKAAGTGLSFDTLSFAAQESGPEAELLALMGDIEREAKRSPGGVSFGLQETGSAAWQQARAGFETLINQINREVLHFAWVETNIDGDLIARSSIGWTGNAETAFLEEINKQDVLLHGRTLRVVTQTRSLRLRLFITIASGAAKISALIATPAGAVLALPAAYHYVMQIMAQVKQLQSIQSS